MCSACKAGFYRAIAFLALCAGMAQASELRVCSDPNNMPFSNSQQHGFENELAQLVAHDLGRTVVYFWIPQHAGFFKVLQNGLCDLVMAVPAESKAAMATRPYYRSTYVFISRRNHGPAIRSLDDPALKNLRIGVQVLGADDASVPPAQELQNRGLTRNIAWYRLYQTYVTPNRPDVLIDAVARGDVDVAVAWGPVAGYFARFAAVPLEIAPVRQPIHSPVPMAFDISMGVRPGDKELLASLNAVIERRRNEIHVVLKQFGIPLAAGTGAAKTTSR